MNKFKVNYKNLKVFKNEEKRLKKSFNNFLESGHYLIGAATKNCEKVIAKKVDRKYCILVSSGTNAIYLSLKSIGIKKDDEVICPSISWVATAAAVSFIGAKPIFVDVNYDQNIDTNKIEKKITKKTKAILFVNFTGQIANFEKIKIIAKKYNLNTIEDAAQSFGAKKGKFSSGNLADLSTFSFNPMKVLKGFGELGCILTDKKSIYKKIRQLRHIGLDEKNSEVLEDVDLNHKPDELQAYLLLDSLKTFNHEIYKRKNLINYYKKKLFKVVEWCEHNTNHSSCYDYQILVKNRDKLYTYLLKSKIEVRIKHPLLMSDQKIFKTNSKELINSKYIIKHKISLPLHGRMSFKDIDYIANKIKSFYKKPI